jgi:hypothetical protein
MAVIHRPMVIINHSQVDVVVSTIVPQGHYDLILNDRHDLNHPVVIVVVAHDMTIDDQVDHPIIGKAVQGLT